MSPLTDPAAINRRLDSVGFFLAEPSLRDALARGAEGRRRHAARADAAGAQPRRPARSRRVARRLRGGWRDLGAVSQAAAAATNSTPPLKAHRRHARRMLANHLEAALADELPLLKRDGGFVREDYDGELDEMRGLRDASRRVILGLERDLIEETGIRSLKIRHNNVLGYYIEVTANHQAIMNGSDEAKAPLHPPPDHGERDALHDHGAGGAGDQDRQRRRPGADHRTRRLRPAGGRDRRQRRRHPRRRRGARRARRVGSACAARGEREPLPARPSTPASPSRSKQAATRSSSRRCGVRPKARSSPMTATCRRRKTPGTARSGC